MTDRCERRPPTLRSCARRFHRASELIGRRWTGAIIFVLLKSRCRFATLRDAIPEITDRMLSDRLQELEQEGIVERTVVPETPVRVEYALTKKGARWRRRSTRSPTGRTSGSKSRASGGEGQTNHVPARAGARESSSPRVSPHLPLSGPDPTSAPTWRGSPPACAGSSVPSLRFGNFRSTRTE